MTPGQRNIHLLGALLILIATGQFLLKVTSGGSLLEATIDFLVLGFAGSLVVYAGSWVAQSEIEPDQYPRIVGWCLGGVGIMAVFLILRAVHPGINPSFTYGTRTLALTIGSIAGLGIGIHEARAITREQELAQRNDELTQTEEQLKKAMHQLEASNEHLNQFASTAAHDLREPLRMVSQYLQLLERRYAGELDNDATEFIEFAVDGAERMQALVNDLLEYARIEEKGTTFEPVDLNAVLQDVLVDLRVQIDEHDAEVTVDELPVVGGDASQLRRVFQNLLSNGIQYSGDDPPRIEIWAEGPGSGWTVSVQDEGIGIDGEYRERIFQLFQRLHTHHEQTGTGIGLALCQRIVEHHGGEIWVESTPGEGSTFSFTFPGINERDSKGPYRTAEKSNCPEQHPNP